MITIDILRKYAQDNKIYEYQKKDRLGILYATIKRMIAEWDKAIRKGMISKPPKEVEESLFDLAILFNNVHNFEYGEGLQFETTFYNTTLREYDKPYMNKIAFWAMSMISTYYNQRLSEIYDRPEQNYTTVCKMVEERIPDGKGFVYKKELKEIKVPVLSLDTKYAGIKTLFTKLDGTPIQYEKDSKNGEGTKVIEYEQIRRHPHFITEKNKYLIPKGQGTYPFFSEYTKTAYKNKEKINTLVLTEGAYKAENGSRQNIHVVGLTSIHHYADRECKNMLANKKYIHKDVEELIKTCKPKYIVILHDGDARDIREKDIELEEDLMNRPFSFYNAARKTKELLQKVALDYKPQIYYATIKSESNKSNPKGLDDLIGVLEKKERTYLSSVFNNLKTGNPYIYFQKMVSTDIELYKWFRLHDAEAFYNKHYLEIQDKTFIFKSDGYKYNKVSNELKKVAPAYVKDMLWVGDSFYKKVEMPVPLKDGTTTTMMQLERRSKTHCIDLYDKNFIEHMREQHYVGFCNIPSHFNYQKELVTPTGRFYNRYKPFVYTPAKGECNATLGFIRHIFGDQYELGLDYIQLLLMQPTLKLPVLILFSPENGTGKSKFCEYLFELFKNNAVFIDNDILKSEFGKDVFIDKLLAMCEETLLERKVESEKIKAIATAEAAMTVNPKGTTPYQLYTYVKFIFCTNRPRMIYATEQDERFWVVRTHKPEKVDVDLKQKMIAEIPFFIDYLMNRQLFTQDKKRGRMWFTFDMIKTEALSNVVQLNEPADARQLRQCLNDYFWDFPDDEVLELSTRNIEQIFLKGKSRPWIEEIVTNMGVERHKKTKRIKFKRLIPDDDNNSSRVSTVALGAQRCWIFKREDFYIE